MALRMDEATLQTLTVGIGAEARDIAVLRREGTGPDVVFLIGFRSDMAGSKATALDAWGAETGRAVVRFDYSGHGRSGGRFEDGTIGRWLEEAEAVVARVCRKPVILVGSSLGGWIALLLAQKLKAERAVAGLVLVAPAADFTERLMEPAFSDEARAALARDGVYYRPSAYGDPYPITRTLLEESRAHLLLGGSIDVGCPVHILQGVRDVDVPWGHAVETVSRLATDDVVLTLVKDGDHSLSRPQDLARLIAAVEAVA
ncbi:alpha/beta hydrolase [Pseudoxanthobacter sp. M-2]|uniref:alpha/beta hydrolase n=1 Tax=Pseudoxanthobacter sp. M-2 TaxID=3078754 RepID=UPI0038FCC903